MNIFLKNKTVQHKYKDSSYVYYIFNDKLVRQGWKIHISGNINDYEEILNSVAEYLIENKIDFKYVHSREILHIFFSANVDIENVGKFITIYPNQKNVKEIIENIYELLKEYKGIHVVSDKRYKNSIVHYRYGMIDDTSEYLETPDKDYIKENRKYFNLPDFVEDIFQEEEVKEVLPQDVVPTEILYSSAGGNIYICKYKDNPAILKEARGFILSFENTTVIDNLLNEIEMMKILKKYSQFPKYFDSFDRFNNKYLLKEFIEGETLTNLITEKTFKERVSLKKLFTQIIDIIFTAHSEGVILNDISSNNFIVNESNGNIFVSFCDLGSSYLENSEKFNYNNGISRIFFDNRVCESKQSDFVKLGYLFINIVFPLNYMLNLNVPKEQILKKLKQVMKKESSIYNIIEYLLLSENICQSKLEKYLKEIDMSLTITRVETMLLNSKTIEEVETSILKKYNQYKYSITHGMNEKGDESNNYFFGKLIKELSLLKNMKILKKYLNNYNENAARRDSIRNFNEFEKRNTSINTEKIDIAVVYILEYIDTKNHYYIKKLKKLLSEIELDIVERENVYVYELEKEYSPYISEGIAGYIALKLIYYKITKDIDIIQELEAYILSLLEEKIICRPGIFNGGLGIVMLIYEYSLLINNSQLLESCLRMLDVLLYFDIEESNILYIPNQNFTDYNKGYIDGTKGYVYILERIINRKEIIDDNIF